MLCVSGWSVQRLDLLAMLLAVRHLPDGSGTKTPWSLDGANVDSQSFYRRIYSTRDTTIRTVTIIYDNVLAHDICDLDKRL